MKHLVLAITLQALVVAMLAGCSPLTGENMQRATEWRYYPGQLAITYLAEEGAQATLFFNPKSSAKASTLLDTKAIPLATGTQRPLDRAEALHPGWRKGG
jgi:hypothetical protein